MLTLRSKTPVRFEYKDDTAETNVVLQPEDDEGTLVRKLQRVIEMVQGPVYAVPYTDTTAFVPEGPLFDAAGAEAALVAPNGWDGADTDNLPEF